MKRCIKYFEPQPLYVTKDNFSQKVENEAVHRENSEKEHVRVVDHTFKTQPLLVTNKDLFIFKVVHGISMDENMSSDGHEANS